MRLSRIIIKNFRRIELADIQIAPATFLIGQNNYGKSSVIRAMEILLSLTTPEPKDFRLGDDGESCQEIQLTGYFTGIDSEVANARGFKGRVVDGQYCYRKTYQCGNPGKPTVECVEYPWTLRGEFADVKTGSELAQAGLDFDRIKEVIGPDISKKLKKGWERDFLDVVADFDTSGEPSFFENPGGITANVISKLPRLIHVPPLTKEDDVGEGNKKSLVSQVLEILFQDVLEGNPTAKEIEKALKILEEQMSPTCEGSLIQKLCCEVNDIIGGIFPGCGIMVNPSLKDLPSVLRPQYEINMYSNVGTDIARQGTGLLRTAVFSMFRYHARLREEKGIETRPLLVAFEEPEIYLHPSAANLLRDTIYALGRTDQIVCTTHSPWMVDLSKDLQSLTKMVTNPSGYIQTINYGVSEELGKLHEDDRSRVKMLQLFDDELSRVFFSEHIVVVEGDSEVVALKATIDLLPEDLQKRVLSRTQIVKARGKAAIISVVKYLKALGIEPFVIHDRDLGTPGAEVFNQPIVDAIGDQNQCIALEECLEDVLGYQVPSSEKPFHAYRRTVQWTSFSEIPISWREPFLRAMGIQASELPSDHHQNAKSRSS